MRISRLILAVALLCAVSNGQVTVAPILQPHNTFVDQSGAPCAGCKLYSYTAGTTTPTPTYTSAGGNVQNTNPITLSVQGGADIWVNSSIAYKFVLKNPQGTTIWTVDDVNSPGGSHGNAIVDNPPGTQTITQFFGTDFNVNTSGGGKFNYNGSEVLSAATGVQLNPSASQTILQPDGTSLNVSGTLKPLHLLPPVTDPGSIPKVIWSDDCDTDPGCFMTEAALMHWVDAGQVNLIGIVADSDNIYAAPAMKAIASYYNHGSISFGAYQGGAGTGGGSYANSIVTQFAPGDTRANYPTCVTTMRTLLAAAANGSITIVGTGYANCIYPLMQSPADGISSLTGAQLIKQKVTKYIQMGGEYPTSLPVCCGGVTPGAEFNFQNGNAAAFSAMYAGWTSGSGFPPIYFVGYTAGINGGNAGIPFNFPTSNPAQYGVKLSPYPTRPSWDTLALWYGIFGNVNSAFIITGSGTNAVSAVDGQNTWANSPANGQYYLTDNQPPAFYEAYLDGQTAAGANFFMPYNQSGSMIYPGLQCSIAYGCLFSGSIGAAHFGQYKIFNNSTNGTLVTAKPSGVLVHDLQLNGASQMAYGVDDGSQSFILGASNGDSAIRRTGGHSFYFADTIGTPNIRIDAGLHILNSGVGSASISMDTLDTAGGGRIIATSGVNGTPATINIFGDSLNHSITNTALKMSNTGFIQVGGNPSVGLDQAGAATFISFKTLGGATITNSSAVPQVGTPTVGQAACIKASGPPVVIGFCSTSVSGSGACTCN